MKTCPDAGHGGKFNNAIAYDGTLEKDENLTNVKLFEQEMIRRGHDVIMTRTADNELASSLSDDLNARVAIANNANVDCFVSFHENGYADPNANGVEVIYGTNASAKSIQWANDCLNRIVGVTGLRYRRTFSQGITVLTKTKMPCILIEFGFMTNKNDMDTIRAKRAEIISAVADSCEAMFGKVDKPVNPFNYELAVDAPLYRYVGEGKAGTDIILDAYPYRTETLMDEDFARIKDKDGNVYLVEWAYLKKI